MSIIMMIKKTTNLTREQRQVVFAKAARVLVNAVAGAGKTATLRACILYLVEQGVDPRKILVLCFGNKTADELRERIGTDVTVSTFHAFANRLVQSDADQKFTVANAGQQLRVLSRTITANPSLIRRIRKGGINLMDLKERSRLLKFLRSAHGDSGLERRLVSDPESGFSDYAPNQTQLGQLYKRFRRRLKEQELIDFPDMLRRGKLALRDQDVPYTHVFVDEYQDMDIAQVMLLREIADKIEFLRIFGDPNQAIFSFMGSQFHDVAGALGAETMELSIAHRLTHATAALASAVLGGAKIVGVRDGTAPAFTVCDSQHRQEQHILKTVKRLKADGITGNEIAILARTKNRLRLIERVLLNAGHSVRATQRTPQLDHLYRMLDLLRWLNKNADTLRDAKLKKDERIAVQRRITKVTGASLTKEQVAKAQQDLMAAALSPSFQGRFSAVRRAYLSAIRACDGPWKEIQKELNLWQPIAGRFNTVKAFRAFVESLHEEPGITVSTIHSAKGKEWDHVIVIDVTEGAIPHVKEVQRLAVDEERRLFYVAVTRARQRLYLFQAPVVRGRVTYQDPSRFLTKAVRKRLAALN